MLATSEILAFLTATIVLNLTPGNDVLFVASQTLGTGMRGGIIAALGIGTGIIAHILALAFGLSELIVYYPIAFHSVKIGGVAYLVFLAYKALKNTHTPLHTQAQPSSTHTKIFFRGTLTNVLNPKVVLFFLAFIPQFLNPSQGDVFLQTVTLGGCFLVSGTAVNISYALLFSTTFSRLKENSSFQKWMNRITGIVFLGLAFKLLLTSKKA